MQFAALVGVLLAGFMLATSATRLTITLLCVGTLFLCLRGIRLGFSRDEPVSSIVLETIACVGALQGSLLGVLLIGSTALSFFSRSAGDERFAPSDRWRD